MTVTNRHWYTQNAGISYPLDDSASCLSDAGELLPSDIVVDLNLRWPRPLGRYAFLSSVAVTGALVTVTIQCADSLESEDFVPLAVLSVTRPVNVGRVYALRAQSQGVGGWIVFGGGVSDRVPYRARFVRPTDGLLAPRAARPYGPLPVSSLGVLNQAETLTGVVRLSAQEPLEIAAEDRLIEGVLRSCVVVRLVDGSGADGLTTPSAASNALGIAQESVFEQFAGPCSGRPESGTCGSPEPIEFVNAVAPDCDGTITIEFTGCAFPSQIMPGVGIAVDCQIGLVDACLPPQIPSSAGLLPGEYTPANIPPYVPQPPVVVPGLSESSVVLGGLPFLECFSGVAGDFLVRAGLWSLGDDDSPTRMCEDGRSISHSESVSYSIQGSLDTATAASRNVAFWDGFDDHTAYRRVTTEVKLVAGPAGARHNGGLALNFRPDVAGRDTYFIAEVDYDAQTFAISRFDGMAFRTVVPVSVPGIQLDKWYRIEASVAGSGSQDLITATLTPVSDAGTPVSVSLRTNAYRPSTGRFGLCSNRSLARFAYFLVENYDA